MKKFPETIATKQDIENLLSDHPEYHGQLKAVLLRSVNEPDKVDQVMSHDIDPDTGEMTNIVTKQITRPNQQWKRWGFKNRGALDLSIATIDQKAEKGIV